MPNSDELNLKNKFKYLEMPAIGSRPSWPLHNQCYHHTTRHHKAFSRLGRLRPWLPWHVLNLNKFIFKVWDRDMHFDTKVKSCTHAETGFAEKGHWIEPTSEMAWNWSAVLTRQQRLSTTAFHEIAVWACSLRQGCSLGRDMTTSCSTSSTVSTNPLANKNEFYDNWSNVQI